MAFFIGCGIVLRKAGKYILVQEVRGEKSGYFNLPAGTLETDEDLLQCITREAKEETGTDITVEHFLGIYQTVIASGNNVVFAIFTGSVADDAIFHSDEHSIVKALTYQEIVELDSLHKLRAPTVLRAIEDFRAGKTLPVGAVQSWRLDTLPAITVLGNH
ncbi:MAG TPA: NUDIX domain-containing protein [Candidatus Saccharimonadales bacterium]